MQEDLPAPTLVLAGKAVAASAGPGKAYRASHNMVVTNVPGPQQPLYFCGAKLVMFTGMAVISDNLGMSHAVTSYDGTLVIAPLSDRQILPDPAFYRECLEEAFDELRRAAAAGTGREETRPAGKKTARKRSAPKARPRKKSTTRGKSKTQ
jgi:hypothetical protein